MKTRGVLAAAGVAALVTVGGTAAFAVGNGHDNEGQDAHKVFVCKYVGTPFEDERLQTGNNPIAVDVHSIKDWTGPVTEAIIGFEFADQQGRSVVIGIKDWNGGGQQNEPTIEDCLAPLTEPSPTPTPTPVVTPTPIVTPEPTVTPTPESEVKGESGTTDEAPAATAVLSDAGYTG